MDNKIVVRKVLGSILERFAIKAFVLEENDDLEKLTMD